MPLDLLGFWEVLKKIPLWKVYLVHQFDLRKAKVENNGAASPDSIRILKCLPNQHT
jgi:hypothetical protein